jgi:hypothetical protein
LSRFLLHIFAAAELEREMIRERVKAARSIGKTLGRPRRVFLRDEAARLRVDCMSWRKISAQLGVPVMAVVEAWATPMARLAKQYGISDVALAKVCRKLAIPVPGRGYWAKKEAGQTLRKLPLPALKQPIQLLKPTLRPEEPKIEEYTTAEERAQVADVKGRDPQLILKRGSLSHPLIVQAREVLGVANTDDREILWTRQSCLDLRVSKAALKRTLHFAAGLITAFEEQGFTVTVGEGCRERTFATIYGQSIGFAILEKVQRVDLTSAPKGGVLGRVLTYGGKPYQFELSGRLSLQIRRPYDAHPKNWSDRKARTLEDQLPDIVAAFMRIALAEKADAEKRAAEKAAAERLAAERAHKAELIKREEARVRALHRAAANWERACRIRGLVAAATDGARREGVSVEPGTPFGDWLIWAAEQADRLDPLKVSPKSIIDSKPIPAPQPSYYGY